MIELALCLETGWPAGDWRALAAAAVRAAAARTPHAVLAEARTSVEISIRLTGDEEIRALNRDYRGKDRPTNVLSFPMIAPGDLAAGLDLSDMEILLGDIVLAHGVCAAEAAERGISLEDHASHLLVHGTLHLLGYDHMTDREAEEMEAIERDALASLGLHDPYPVED